MNGIAGGMGLYKLLIIREHNLLPELLCRGQSEVNVSKGRHDFPKPSPCDQSAAKPARSRAIVRS